jgi:hypothetical protein
MKTSPDPAKKTIYKDTCATAQDFCSQKKKKNSPRLLYHQSTGSYLAFL